MVELKTTRVIRALNNVHPCSTFNPKLESEQSSITRQPTHNTGNRWLYRSAQTSAALYVMLGIELGFSTNTTQIAQGSNALSSIIFHVSECRPAKCSTVKSRKKPFMVAHGNGKFLVQHHQPSNKLDELGLFTTLV